MMINKTFQIDKFTAIIFRETVDAQSFSNTVGFVLSWKALKVRARTWQCDNHFSLFVGAGALFQDVAKGLAKCVTS